MLVELMRTAPSLLIGKNRFQVVYSGVVRTIRKHIVLAIERFPELAWVNTYEPFKF